jgi:hypothetical protein
MRAMPESSAVISTIAPETTALMAAACADINKYGSAFYFSPETVAVGKEHGLDGFRFYFLGRGGVLGDVEAPVIESAFGWWSPELVAKMWNTAREKMVPRDAGRLYLTCCQNTGRARLANVADLGAFCSGAETIVAATNPAGMALYAGLAELRGSAHIMAVMAVGLDPKLAHVIKRPDMVKSFGWGEDPIEVTNAQRAQLDEAERITDVITSRSYAALPPAAHPAFLAALGNICAALQ